MIVRLSITTFAVTKQGSAAGRLRGSYCGLLFCMSSRTLHELVRALLELLWADGWAGGRAGRWTDGRMGRRADARADGWTD